MKEEKKTTIVKTALKLFSKNGFYATTIPVIAKSLNMSVGNIYNYFSSKEFLAKEIIEYISDYLAKYLKKINKSNLSTKEKTKEIVKIYFKIAQNEPEMIEFFLRVYLSNREVFRENCVGMVCINAFMTEIMIYFEEGVKNGDLKNQDFFSAFGLFMGYLGGMVFLNGENILPKSLEEYIDDIGENIYKALSK